MGPSGSGKTTLLNLIAGIDRPNEGSVTVAGTDVARLGESDLAKWRARHIGLVFQFYNLLPVLTAYENVELPLLLTPLSKAERKQHVEAALSLVGLADRLHHYPRQLSGGQEQRVGIARAIVTDPTLLVCDEPTGDLDRKAGGRVLTLLEQLNREFTDDRHTTTARRRTRTWSGTSTRASYSRGGAVTIFKIVLRSAFRHGCARRSILGIATAVMAFGLIRT
jgi:putative ABC transport system ATP-binding protein